MRGLKGGWGGVRACGDGCSGVLQPLNQAGGVEVPGTGTRIRETGVMGVLVP